MKRKDFLKGCVALGVVPFLPRFKSTAGEDWLEAIQEFNGHPDMGKGVIPLEERKEIHLLGKDFVKTHNIFIVANVKKRIVMIWMGDDWHFFRVDKIERNKDKDAPGKYSQIDCIHLCRGDEINGAPDKWERFGRIVGLEKAYDSVWDI